MSASSVPEKSPTPPPQASGQPARKTQLLKRYQDDLPPAPPYIPDAADEDEEVPQSLEPASSTTVILQPFRTERDQYSIVRTYVHGKPSITPDGHHSLSNLADSPYLALDSMPSTRLPARSIIGSILKQTEELAKSGQDYFTPFRNAFIFRLMSWHYSASLTKSIGELNSLVTDVILAPDFQSKHFIGFSVVKEQGVMDSYRKPGSVDNPTPFSFDDTWIKGFVEISLPCDGVKQKESKAPRFRVKVHYRKPLEILKMAFSELEAANFHLFPFKASWNPSPGVEEHVYSEIYTCNAWLREYEKILQTHLNGPNTHIKAIMVGLMIWSDSTVLAQFGTADIWPIYLYIGHQSKYTHVKPLSFSAHHIVYLPKVVHIFLELTKC